MRDGLRIEVPNEAVRLLGTSLALWCQTKYAQLSIYSLVNLVTAFNPVSLLCVGIGSGDYLFVCFGNHCHETSSHGPKFTKGRFYFDSTALGSTPRPLLQSPPTPQGHLLPFWVFIFRRFAKCANYSGGRPRAFGVGDSQQLRFSFCLRGKCICSLPSPPPGSVANLESAASSCRLAQFQVLTQNSNIFIAPARDVHDHHFRFFHRWRALD